jgi:hypothetical protein
MENKMAKRKTKNATELYELLMQRVDLRTEWGKDAEKTLASYLGNNNTKALSLLQSLVMELNTDNLADVCALNDEFYVTDQKERCICGTHLSKEVYLMQYRPESVDNDKLKAAIGKGITARKDYVPMGSSCHKHMPTILADFGAPGLRKRIDDSEKLESKLEENLNISSELRKKLEKAGIDIDQLQKILSLEHSAAVLDGDESGLLYDLDAGTKKNSINWFREQVKDSDFDNPLLSQIWNKLKNAAHLVTKEELALVRAYSNEYRLRNANVLLAGVKQDLLYLSGLPEDHPYNKEGKIDVDRKYKPLPAVFSSKKRDKRTIIELLNQDMITRAEALGIRAQFPGIVERRIATNRETSQKYGKGRTWDYLLNEIRPVFEQQKKDIHEEYKADGKISTEQTLPKKEYNLLKEFFIRAELGKSAERENYLKMHDIKMFTEIAPQIVAIGRKLRYAKSKKDVPASVIRDSYTPVEDLSEKIKELTGCSDAEQVIDMIANAKLVKDSNFNSFQYAYGDILNNGIVADKWLSSIDSKKNTIKKLWETIKKEQVEEVDVATKKALDNINEYTGLKCLSFNCKPFAHEGEIKYASHHGILKIDAMQKSIEKLLDRIGYSEETQQASNENLSFLNKNKDAVYLSCRGGWLFEVNSCNPEHKKIGVFEMKRSSPDIYGICSAYELKQINEAADAVKNCTEADNELIRKAKAVSDSSVLNMLGIKEYAAQGADKLEGKVFVSPDIKSKIEAVYSQWQKYENDPLWRSAKKRQAVWESSQFSEKKRIEEELSSAVYEKLVDGNIDIWEIINGAVGGFIRQKTFVRTPNYTRFQPVDKYARYNYGRFAGDGIHSWNSFAGIASGQELSFKISERVKDNLHKDMEEKIITDDQYKTYLKRIELFEEGVNNLLK